MGETPHWEHGHRVHGYWIDTTRYGRVGLTCPGVKLEYIAEFRVPHTCDIEETFTELRPAKRWIEQMYKYYYTKVNTDVIE